MKNVNVLLTKEDIVDKKKYFGAFSKDISSTYRYFSMGGKGGQHS